MDIILQRILEQIEKKGITEKKFLLDNGYSASAMSDWKAERMNSYKKRIDKIADYFGVSVDYLLGRTDEDQKSPPPERLVLALGGGGADIPKDYIDNLVEATKELNRKIDDAKLSVVKKIRENRLTLDQITAIDLFVDTLIK